MFLFSDSKSLIPWTDWHPVFIIKMITGWKTVSGFCQQSRCFACCARHGFWLVPSFTDTGLWLARAGIVMFWGVLHDATCFVYMTEAAWHTGINDSSRGGFWQIINPGIQIIYHSHLMTPSLKLHQSRGDGGILLLEVHQSSLVLNCVKLEQDLLVKLNTPLQNTNQNLKTLNSHQWLVK